MTSTITNFLVGIGFEYDKKSADAIGSGIDGITTKAKQLGAVVAGAFGIKALTTDFAEARDTLGKFSDVMGLVPENVLAFGNALATEGGSLESFLTQIESIERARARIRVGDVGFFAPAGKAGLDPNAIADAETATDAYLGLADAFAKMSQQERLNAAETLGLDQASILLLSQGRDAVEELVAKFEEIRPISERSTEQAAAFNRAWVEAKANASGFIDIISDRLLPKMTDAVELVNYLANIEREETREAVDVAAEMGITTGSPALAASAFIVSLINSYSDSAPDEQVDNIISNATESATSHPGYGSQSSYKPPSTYGPQTPATTQQQAPQVSNVSVTLELDGATLDKRTVRVVDGMAQTAIDDIASSTGG